MGENSGGKTVAVAGIQKPTMRKAAQSYVAGKGAIPRAEWSGLVEMGLPALNGHTCHCQFSGTTVLSRSRTQMYLANGAHFMNCLLLPRGMTSLTHSHSS